MIDITGQRFGMWTVIAEAPRVKGVNSRWWKCLCDCGTVRVVRYNNLQSKNSLSCGCSRPGSIKHGQSIKGNVTQVYQSWRKMIQRCRPNHVSRKYYLDKGIEVCERWKCFDSFLEDMGEPPLKGLTLDRIDNNKGYFKENCRWATRAEQNRNTSKTRNFTIDGVTKCLTDWCHTYHIGRHVVRYRMNKGLSILDALKSPVMVTGSKKQ